MLPEPDTLSPRRFAYVLPAFTLAFTQRGTRGIRITQTYTVPKAVELTAPTRFYVGPCKPDRARPLHRRARAVRDQAKTRRVRAGRYVARADRLDPRLLRGALLLRELLRLLQGLRHGRPGPALPAQVRAAQQAR